MQWLQQVVAGCGDEPCLAEIGGLGLGAARLELGGARGDALLQRLGGAAQLAVAVAQRLGGTHALGDVVAGRDEPAARQRIEAQFDDAAVARADLVGLGRLRPAQQGHDLGRGAEPQRRDTDRHGLAVERQQGGEAVVEDLEIAVAVEGGDAHADMVERVAQDLVVVADGLRGLVDQGARAARQQPPAPPEGGDDDPRRGRSQGARQHALGARQCRFDRQRAARQRPPGPRSPMKRASSSRNSSMRWASAGVWAACGCGPLSARSPPRTKARAWSASAPRASTSSDTTTSSRVLTAMPTTKPWPTGSSPLSGAGSQPRSGAAALCCSVGSRSA